MMSLSSADIRLIAFYLPQYHPIPENDEWWGKGFTEWTNVARARPLFKGHYQPHLPADLGFYDLRLPDARQLQADLAGEYGLHGFCYYHYWFNGRRILERPFTEVLETGKPDFPFCLCWANENWTRRWDGQDQEVLLRQEYSAEDDIAHIRSLITALKDPRYITIDGKPLLLIYRLSRLPNPVSTIACWRREAVKAGLPGLFLCNVESFSDEHRLAATSALDAAVEFAPDWGQLGPPVAKFKDRLWGWRSLSSKGGVRSGDCRVYDYSKLAHNMITKAKPGYLKFPCVTPMWDNTARRKRAGTVLDGSTPGKYQQWLESAIDSVCELDSQKQIVFVNAWNEWGEGNHLEPCLRWGRSYLEATQAALGSRLAAMVR